MDRPGYLAALQAALARFPVVALLGPRQCGKTTLARMFAENLHAKTALGSELTLLDLEDPTDLARLENPKLALQDLQGLVIIDEIQRRPELFPLLRVLVDRPGSSTRFLITGSASRDLLRQSSESLAGRLTYLELTPFTGREVDSCARLWLRGGFPPAYLAENDAGASAWRKAYVRTFLERDIPALGIHVAPAALRRFWMMLAHFHGQVLNASDIGRSMDISDTTVRRYLDVLTGTLVLRQLSPWHENIKKRQIKRPKIYFRDSGLLHSFLGVESHRDLMSHPRLGASWEGFALEEVARALPLDPEDLYFWATHNRAELDLLAVSSQRRVGFEFKYSDAPKVTRSMRIAFEDLSLDALTVIFPGRDSFPLAEGIVAVGLETWLARQDSSLSEGT
ncbi:MAG: ATP-binding protein [Deltaproteobacteria bacterium]|nr:ATP-binding protein [Deltaproteobacteria bacterium]